MLLKDMQFYCFFMAAVNVCMSNSTRKIGWGAALGSQGKKFDSIEDKSQMITVS